jgi:hypothetical protein
MKILMFYRGLVYLLFFQLVIGCRSEVLEPDKVEIEPLYIRGIANNDSFSFSNGNDYMHAESFAEANDSSMTFIFSFTDTRPAGRKIEIRFLTNSNRISPVIDSAIMVRDYPWHFRNVWGAEFDRAVEIIWYEGDEVFSSSDIPQIDPLVVSGVDEIVWNGVRYKRVRLSGYCTLFSDRGGVAKELRDFEAQIVYRIDR